MIFLNTFCGYQDSIEYTPTAISDIQKVELMNGIYDDLFITKNPNLDGDINVETSTVFVQENNYSPLSLPPISQTQQLDEITIYFTSEDVNNNCPYLYCTDGIESFYVNIYSMGYGGCKVSEGESYNYIDVNGQKWMCDIIILDFIEDTFIIKKYVEPNVEQNVFVPTTQYNAAGTLGNPMLFINPKLTVSESGSLIDIYRVPDEETIKYEDTLSLEFIYHTIQSNVNINKNLTWDWDTVLHASFNETTEAGNVDFTLEDTNYIIIKRRKSGEFIWKTIYVQPINELTDFDISGVDTTARSSTTYEYAAVAYSEESGEGTYNTDTVESSFDKIYLVEKDQMYGTSIWDGYCDTTRNVPSAVTPLLNNKYPIYIRNSRANYDTGSLSLGFVETKNCPFNFDDKNRVPYQREVMDFLCNAKPKLLKLPDGRMWLIMVTGNPTDTADNYYANRKINFEWTEIGDCESQRDLYNAGLLDVYEEWWVN